MLIFGILLGTTGCGDFIFSSMIEVINHEVKVRTDNRHFGVNLKK